MDVHVALGEWMHTLQSLMHNAADGDCFCLPSPMHLHAFILLKEASFADRDFKVKVNNSQ
jgi:hypothetical protein